MSPSVSLCDHWLLLKWYIWFFFSNNNFCLNSQSKSPEVTHSDLTSTANTDTAMLYFSISQLIVQYLPYCLPGLDISNMYHSYLPMSSMEIYLNVSIKWCHVFCLAKGFSDHELGHPSRQPLFAEVRQSSVAISLGKRIPSPDSATCDPCDFPYVI